MSSVNKIAKKIKIIYIIMKLLD